MSRLAFALSVIALTGLLCALIVALLIGLGFQGEGCRFPNNEGRVGAALKDLAMIAGFGGVFYGGLVAGLAAVLKGRPAAVPFVRWIVFGAAVMFLAAMAGQAIFMVTCNGGSALVQGARGVLILVAKAAAATTAGGILWATVRGLAR